MHAAVVELLGEQRWDEVNIPLIAERSGVHPATIYRRWGSVAALADDLVAARLGEAAPIPDTGTLRGDLELAAVRFADAIAGPRAGILLRAAALSAPTDEAPVTLRTRAGQLQHVLDRAAARGEKAPTLVELLEGITAPLYFHALLFGRPADARHARELVDRLMIFVEAR
ncbi:MAG: TetR/AcrR family transcriptional regulator C-terminal ligand-binding domain-containing protein [Thermoleophilaceae bacterium]